jgi:hypothetical protein
MIYLFYGHLNINITRSVIGLPDGILANQKSQFRCILEGLGKNWYMLWPFGIFKTVWCILRPFFVNFVVIWYTFIFFGMLYEEKSGNPA